MFSYWSILDYNEATHHDNSFVRKVIFTEHIVEYKCKKDSRELENEQNISAALAASCDLLLVSAVLRDGQKYNNHVTTHK